MISTTLRSLRFDRLHRFLRTTQMVVAQHHQAAKDMAQIHGGTHVSTQRKAHVIYNAFRDPGESSIYCIHSKVATRLITFLFTLLSALPLHDVTWASAIRRRYIDRL